MPNQLSLLDLIATPPPWLDRISAVFGSTRESNGECYSCGHPFAQRIDILAVPRPACPACGRILACLASSSRGREGTALEIGETTERGQLYADAYWCSACKTRLPKPRHLADYRKQCDNCGRPIAGRASHVQPQEPAWNHPEK